MLSVAEDRLTGVHSCANQRFKKQHFADDDDDNDDDDDDDKNNNNNGCDWQYLRYFISIVIVVIYLFSFMYLFVKSTVSYTIQRTL